MKEIRMEGDPVAAQNPGLVETRASMEFKKGRLVFKFPTADEDAAIFRKKDVCVCSGPPVCVCSGPCVAGCSACGGCRGPGCVGCVFAADAPPGDAKLE